MLTQTDTNDRFCAIRLKSTHRINAKAVRKDFFVKLLEKSLLSLYLMNR